MNQLSVLTGKLAEVILSVPVRMKIAGIMLLPVLILGLALNYWVRTGLSDWLSYLLSNERVQLAMQAGSRSVLFVTVLAAIISILLTFLLMFILTRPLLELREVARKVVDGELETRAFVWAEDEIGEVAKSINVMIDQLVSGNKELARINRNLESMNQVAMAAGRALELEDVLNATLKATLNVMGLESGWIFLRDPDSHQFYLSNRRNIPKLLGRSLEQNVEMCPCQQDLLSGEFGQKVIVRECQRFHIHEQSKKPFSHISIPLEARGQQFGVVNLLSLNNSKMNSDDLELLAAIGAQASEIVANARLHGRLVEKETARQALLEALVTAQEDERTRLAQELHDGAGQTLTSLLLRLKALENQTDSDELRENIAGMCNTVSETIDQIRELSYLLRPVALQEFGLEVAMKTLIQETVEEAGIRTDFLVNLNGVILAQEIETTLYRIAQECLTNILRHARASHVVLELTAIPYAVCFRIEDDGVGFDPSLINIEDGKRRLGLLGVKERAEMLGGSTVVYSSPDQGTSIQIRIPIESLLDGDQH